MQGTLSNGIYTQPNSTDGMQVKCLPVFIIHTDNLPIKESNYNIVKLDFALGQINPLVLGVKIKKSANLSSVVI